MNLVQWTKSTCRISSLKGAAISSANTFKQGKAGLSELGGVSIGTGNKMCINTHGLKECSKDVRLLSGSRTSYIADIFFFSNSQVVERCVFTITRFRPPLGLARARRILNRCFCHFNVPQCQWSLANEGINRKIVGPWYDMDQRNTNWVIPSKKMTWPFNSKTRGDNVHRIIWISQDRAPIEYL